MEKLKELVKACKCSVRVVINDHRDNCETVRELLKSRDVDDEDVEKEVVDKMVELDTVVEVHFYPDTPVGFYCVFHYDIDAALTEALEIMESRGNRE